MNSNTSFIELNYSSNDSNLDTNDSSENENESYNLNLYNKFDSNIKD
jgi:hypothetical protein